MKGSSSPRRASGSIPSCSASNRPAGACRRGGAALFLQPGKHKFDVLAGAQFGRGIVRARTEIAARPHAANRHAVTRFRNRVADPKFGEERFGAHVLKSERLFAAELATQAALPVDQREIGGGVGA